MNHLNHFHEYQQEHSNYVFPLLGEALKCVVYIYNNTPQRALDWRCSNDLFPERVPNLTTYVFGSTVYSKIKNQQKKFSDIAKQVIFVGYSSNRKA